ncbi:MAG: hypothetical protein MUC48_02575 [Leptolyngbya sp. Prado105]|jgi:hypothetical protein|nr:hypothetical protein [Leptolyngbya sp. Prado105]
MHRSTRLARKLWNAKSAFALALAITVLPACNQVTQQEARNVTTENITENTNQYIGRTVTIRSKPIRNLGSNTFTMSSEQFFGREPIVVVNASGTPFVLPENQNLEVQVTGQVRQFVLSEINQSYNLGLQPDVYREYENRPAIIAQSIALAPEPGQISQNPSAYYGRTIAVDGEVEDVRSANSFTLENDQLLGGQDLLVLNPNSGQPVQDDQNLAVTGVLRPFVVADLEREYGFTWDRGFVQQLEAEYRDRPVLVATGIYPSALPDNSDALWGLLGLAGLLGLFGLTSGGRRRHENRRDLQDAPAYRDPSIR